MGNFLKKFYFFYYFLANSSNLPQIQEITKFDKDNKNRHNTCWYHMDNSRLNCQGGNFLMLLIWGDNPRILQPLGSA